MSTSLTFPRRKLLVVLALAVLLLFTTVAATHAAPVEAERETVAASYDGFYYTVRWGDYLSLLAQRYGTTVQAILWANPQITNPNRIYAGQVIFIPTGYYPPPPPPPVYCRYYHYVSYGQTLYSIARWYGVNPWSIAQANGIYNMNLIYAGQTLCIP
ncbi:MAG: LysM peptidoglycan-binding domain-containing protein [Chloroflexi bacterium]|nr:LysM peptidoglycan-binding domain-containing protein [Chloroflexota bacterium]